MTFRKGHIALALAIVGFSTIGFAQDLRGRIAQMEHDQQIQEASIENTRMDLTEKTSEIAKIKNGNGSGIVSKFLLQKKMREAQAVSKDLENQMKKQTKLMQALRVERANLMSEIDGQIKTLTASKNPHQLANLQQLQQLISEKDRLLLLQQRAVLDIPRFNLSSAGNEKEDLVEKLHVVEDLQKSMNQKIAYLKAELSEERSKEFLRNEVSHFIDEENFFGEQSFISSGLNRKENSKNLNNLALKKDNTLPANNIPTTDPTTPPAGDPAQPTTGAPTGTDPTAGASSSATPEVAVAPIAPQVSSQSTSFQQPQELGMFEALSDQIQESIRDTNPKMAGKAKAADIAPAKNTDKKISKRTKRGALEQNLALSQKILSDLDILRQNLSHQIQTLD